MERSMLRTVRMALPLTGLMALAACGSSSDLTGTARQPVSFSFTTRANAAEAAALSPASRGDLVLGANGELVLTKIQLVLNRLELTSTDAVTCVSADSTGDDTPEREDAEAEHEGCEQVSRTPVVVDIPVDATVHTAINVPLSAGTYTRLEARLSPAASVATSNPELAGASVRVTGTFNGAPFTFTTAIRSKIEMEFNPPRVVDATTQNATVNIDVSSWFKNSAGGLIDPATANLPGANAARVSSNIRASFRAFEDDDRGGDDDHGHHGGSGNSGGRD